MTTCIPVCFNTVIVYKQFKKGRMARGGGGVLGEPIDF